MRIHTKLGLMLLGLATLSNATTFDRCEWISKKFAGKYRVELFTYDGSVEKLGEVKFTKTSEKYTFNANNLQILGEILLPGAPNQVKLVPFEEECLIVGRASIEDNTLGPITEAEDLKAFSVNIEDEDEDVNFITFTKI